MESGGPKVLETAEEIQERRQEVLTRYKRFKELVAERGQKLEDSYHYQVFRRDADDLEKWILEKLKIADDKSYEDPTNIQGKYLKHESFEAEVQAKSRVIPELEEIRATRFAEGHFAHEDTKAHLEELHKLWDLLVELTQERGALLLRALKLQQYLQECTDILEWIGDKEAIVTSVELGEDWERTEVLHKKFEEFQTDLEARREKVDGINQYANECAEENHPELPLIKLKQDEVNTAWKRLLNLALQRQATLSSAADLQRFRRDVTEAIQWIKEKEPQVTSEDYGKDLVSSEALFHSHKGLERSLAVMEDKVKELCAKADKLKLSHPPEASQIQQMKEDLVSNWEHIRALATNRYAKLEASCGYQRFLSDYEELSGWMKEKTALISADELPTDVASGEALLDRHRQHKHEIDSYEERFQSADETGQALLDASHEASDEVREKMTILADDWAALLGLWDQQQLQYLQCWYLHLFYRDSEQVDSWMSRQEDFLENEDLGNSLGSVEALLQKHDDFEEAFTAQEEKITTVDNNAKKLIDSDHYDSENIAALRDSLLARRDALRKRAATRRKLLEDSWLLQKLYEDSDDLKNWINKKKKLADDEDYKDIQNLKSRVQKQEEFKNELEDYQRLLNTLEKTGQEMIEADHYASDKVADRVGEVVSLWKELLAATEHKGNQLYEANQELQFKNTAEDLEHWLGDMEQQVASEDYGKGLADVQNLLRKHGFLESAVGTHQDQVDTLIDLAAYFEKIDHPDAGNIKARQESLVSRFEALKEPLSTRKKKLIDFLHLHQICRDTEDEEAWIQETEPSVASTYLGKDLIVSKKLLNRHQVIQDNIASHEPHIQAITEKGNKMVEEVPLESVPQELSITGVSATGVHTTGAQYHWSPYHRSKVPQELSTTGVSTTGAQYHRSSVPQESVPQELSTTGVHTTGVSTIGAQYHRSQYHRSSVPLESVPQESVPQELSTTGVSTTGVSTTGVHTTGVSTTGAQYHWSQYHRSSENKITELDHVAEQLIADDHYAKEEIAARFQRVLDRWNALKELLIAERTKLGDYADLKKFHHDLEDLEEWISEMLPIACDESYKDPTNIQRKYLKHQAFENEVQGRAEEVEGVLNLGNSLIEREACDGNEETMKGQLEELDKHWNYLLEKTIDKGQKLNEASRQQRFNTGIQDFKFWLSEAETLLAMKDQARDLASAGNLLKKHQLLETEMLAREDALKDLNELAADLLSSGTFNVDQIVEERDNVNERFLNVQDLAATHHEKLKEAYALFQFFQDLDDEESWIEEKLLRVSSQDYGRDLQGVQNLLKKHKRLEGELVAHEPTIQSVLDAADRLGDRAAVGQEEIQERLTHFFQHWEELKELAAARGRHLEESLEYLEFMQNAEEEEAWISEKEAMVARGGSGDTLAMTQAEHFGHSIQHHTGGPNQCNNLRYVLHIFIVGNKTNKHYKEFGKMQTLSMLAIKHVDMWERKNKSSV
ncbi:spectrin alpha chain, erythrocytic 1-like [Leptonychotes weddellii]|uniref:Spectrin alpha chain, erythrocytic 1-like n=1 Tax=Leptonychotes weddellii TaxID=9713 RepID=A0A2U3YB26_LEPWE|nr:spectrin alpha chain, erythrocytic 1-like [Leptonychotes weddellii]